METPPSPTVSVVVPVYKAEAWLPRCVESLLAQTFPDFELLLIDDGSPDGCGALCDGFACRDGRVRALHQTNGGASSARNAGIRAARGRYLTFVDSDDLVSPHLLQAAAEAAGAFPGDFVFWAYADERSLLHTGPITSPPIPFAPSEIGRLYISAKLGAVWAMLFNTALLQQGIFFDESLEMGEDLEFVFRYARALFSARPGSRFRYLPDPLYFYDNDGKAGSLSRRFPPDFCVCWSRVFEALLAQNREFFHMPEQDEYAILHNYMRTVGVGLYALLTQPGVPNAQRRAAARGVLQSPPITRLTTLFFERRYYSPYAWPFRLKWLWAIRRIGAWQEREGINGYYRHYWVGYAIHRRLHPGSPAPV